MYHRPADPARPVVRVDEAGRPLVGDVREPLPVRAGRPAREDAESGRHGTATLFRAFEPLAGRRLVEVTDRRPATDFARFRQRLLDESDPDAATVVLATDTRNTHGVGSRYEAFAPEEARRLAGRIEWPFTPKHGSWLDMAEVERSVLSRQCLDRRIPDRATRAVGDAAWQAERHAAGAKADGQFTTADARTRLRRLYPVLATD